METLPRLLFELSSNERINIMLELQKNGLKLSQLSRKLDLTVTEASRHLQRLNEAMLIQKDSEGYFQLTPYGKLSMFLLPALGFVSKHRKYFQEYDISKIPMEFVERIGELDKCAYVSETLRNLAEGEKRIREAREFVWILSDQILASSIPILAENMRNTPFDLRIVLPEGMFPPEEQSRLPSTIPYIHKRVLPKVNALVVMTETYAIFCLPNKNDRIDYTGFAGTDHKFLKWCRDLFLHYWNKGKPPIQHSQASDH